MASIVGKCPMGCGSTLFIGSGGYVTCNWEKCPDPGYVSVLMDHLPEIKKTIALTHGVELPVRG